MIYEGDEKGDLEPELSVKLTISHTKSCMLVTALDESLFYLLPILLSVIHVSIAILDEITPYHTSIKFSLPSSFMPVEVSYKLSRPFPGQSCPILSNRVHPTKQHSIFCKSENCISLERSGQSAVDSIDSFDLSNGKVHYRLDECGRVLSIRSIRSIFHGKVHYRFDKCGRRLDNCISLATTATRCKIVKSIDLFDWWE